MSAVVPKCIRGSADVAESTVFLNILHNFKGHHQWAHSCRFDRSSEVVLVVDRSGIVLAVRDS